MIFIDEPMKTKVFLYQLGNSHPVVFKFRPMKKKASD